MSESESQSISFFVPCLNEEGNVGTAIDNIVQVSGELGLVFEILVVDDASTDGTVAEIEQRQRKYTDVPIQVVQNPVCRGLGRNYFVAAQRASGFYYMLINGDAAEPIESIRTMLSHFGDVDAVIPYFGQDETRTWPRRMLSGTFTVLTNMLSGHKIQYYNGPVIHITENVRLWYAETTGFGYQAELLCRLLDEGITYREVQVANSDRDVGASKAFTIVNLLSVANSLSHILLRRIERIVFDALLKRKMGKG